MVKFGKMFKFGEMFKFGAMFTFGEMFKFGEMVNIILGGRGKGQGAVFCLEKGKGYFLWLYFCTFVICNTLAILAFLPSLSATKHN